jgi:hypothetical protein
MRHARTVHSIGVVFVALASLLLGAPTSFASPAGFPTAHVPGHPDPSTPTEVSKVVLDEQSIDGPSLWSLPGDAAPKGPDNAVSLLGWTGTDPLHKLNLMLSPDGVTYGDKLTLDEESSFRPAVLVTHNGGANPILVAWTGTDPSHSLNVMYDAYHAQTKLTLAESSISAPALAWYQDQVWIAWTGTDPNHTLNVMALGPHGLAPGQKTTLYAFTSNARPTLNADTRDHRLLLTWSYTTALPWINVAESEDGADWETPLVAPPPQTSNVGPSIMSLNPQPSGMPIYYWAWTGTDPLHSLNVTDTFTLNNWPDPITTLDEQCFGGPSLGYAGHLGHIIVAWTGINPGHNINIGVIAV